MSESWTQQALWFVGLQNLEAPQRVYCHNEPEGSGAAPIVQDGPLAEQMKSPSPVLHYAEGTGKISAPLAEEGHD